MKIQTLNLFLIVRIDHFKTFLDQTPEDTYFWFGTTNEGKDLFNELWKGARISLLMALGVVIINTAIGLTIEQQLVIMVVS